MKSILISTTKTEHLSTLSSLLQKRDYIVIPGIDADTALSFFHQGGKVDAVIADYEMAGFPDLLRTVKMQEPVPPPVIVMSDRVVVSDYLTALSSGAFDFFFWPVRPAEFLRSIDNAVMRSISPGLAGAQQSPFISAKVL